MWVIRELKSTTWNNKPWIQNNGYIPSDFPKNVFWMIIWFLAILHSYTQGYVDQEDDAEEVGYSLKNVICGKVKIPNFR